MFMTLPPSSDYSSNGDGPNRHASVSSSASLSGITRQAERKDDANRRHREVATDLPETEEQIRAHASRTQPYFAPMANSVLAPRTYITPSDSAGVAINVSPIAFVARSLKVVPASTTSMSPSS